MFINLFVDLFLLLIIRPRTLRMRRRRSRARSGGEKSRFRHGWLLSSTSVWSVSAEKVSFRPSTRSFATKRSGSQEAHRKRRKRQKRRLGKGLPQNHRRCNLPLRGSSKTPFRLRSFCELCEESRLHWKFTVARFKTLLLYFLHL